MCIRDSIRTEYPTGTEAYLLPLCNNIHFKLLLEMSINSRHSLASYAGSPIASNRPATSLQYTRLPSDWKSLRSSASLLRQNVTLVPWSSSHFSCNLEANSSGKLRQIQLSYKIVQFTLGEQSRTIRLYIRWMIDIQVIGI